jgi:predicted amidohydrolase YtcJ
MIEQIHIDALLSAAAYAKWDKNEAAIKQELMNRGFTKVQYKAMFDTNYGMYEVVDYTQDLNGFSATIFRNIDQSSPNYNKLTVSFRATDGPLESYVV